MTRYVLFKLLLVTAIKSISYVLLRKIGRIELHRLSASSPGYLFRRRRRRRIELSIRVYKRKIEYRVIN